MKEQYKTVKLGDIATFQYGSYIRSTETSTAGKYPVYSGYRITGYLSAYTYEKPQLLVVARGVGGTGDVKISPPKCTITNLSIIMHLNPEKAEKEYLFYKFQNHNLRYLDSGSAQSQITIQDLKELELSLPPLPEQHRIANILSSFDNKIELLRKENNTLENIAQSIFKEWFVKYNFPNKDGKPYRDNNGKMIDSELGLIPEGWRVVSLTDIAEFTNGLPMQKYRPKAGDDFLPVIKIKELNNGYSNDTEKARADLDEKYIINPGDVVFSWSGSIGMDLWKYSKGGLNQHLFKVTSKEYPKWFYYYWIKHYLPQFKQIAEGKATTMGHIQRSHLEKTLIAIPQKKINTFCLEDFLKKIVLNNQCLESLLAEKEILLNKLITGSNG